MQVLLFAAEASASIFESIISEGVSTQVWLQLLPILPPLFV